MNALMVEKIRLAAWEELVESAAGRVCALTTCDSSAFKTSEPEEHKNPEHRDNPDEQELERRRVEEVEDHLREACRNGERLDEICQNFLVKAKAGPTG